MKQYINLQRDHYTGMHEHCNCCPETCPHPNGRVLKPEFIVPKRDESQRVRHIDEQDVIGASNDERKFAVITSIINGRKVLISYLHDIKNVLAHDGSANSFIKLTPRENPLTKEQWKERVNQIRNK